MPGGTGAHFADASVRVQRQKGRATLPGQRGLRAASRSRRRHGTREGPGRVRFHLEDVEARSDGRLQMQLRMWGACSDLAVCHQEKGYSPRWAVNQNSARLLCQGQSGWERAWRSDILRGASSPLPVNAQDTLSVQAVGAKASGAGSSLTAVAIGFLIMEEKWGHRFPLTIPKKQSCYPGVRVFERGSDPASNSAKG